MRVAHVVPVFPPYGGGTGTVASNQAEGLAAAGVAVSVFTPWRAQAPAAPSGVEVRPLRPLLASGNAAVLPSILWRARHHDLIHLHYPFFGTAELVALRRRLGGPPLVVQYHMDVTGQGGLRWIARWHRRLLFPMVVSAADAIIVTTMDYARSSFLAPHLEALESRVVEIPGGVDTAHFCPDGEADPMISQFADGRPVVFFLAGLDDAHYFKGLHVLIEALRLLPGAALAIGGDGPLRPRYEAHTAQCGLGERSFFAGHIPAEALPRYYRAADVVVLPSIDRTEAFGMVLLEAMACGTPVVASRLPGVRTVVDDGNSGLLAEPGNAAEFAEQIGRCLRESAEMGRRARHWVEQRYASQIVAQPLLRLYHSLAG